MKHIITEMTFEDRDEYLRRDIAHNIIKLITSKIDVSPMIIDGDWGTGKSEFCHKLIHLIGKETDSYKVVYIDAFNEDHTDAPILTLLAAIVALLPQEERSTLIKKALPAIRFGLKTTLKAGANWLLKQNTEQLAEDFQEAIKDSSNAVIDGTIEALLEDHIESDKNIRALKEALTEISKKTPMVIFIDELDRCKPSFAISILENIKHVFEVDNVHFVLVTNTKQLEASIHHIYGHSVDAKRYLDKFIRFTVNLPAYFKPDSHNNVLSSSLHWFTTASKSETLSKIDNPTSEFISSLIKLKGLSLREVETLARHVEIYQTISPNPITDDIVPACKFLYVIGIFICCFDKENAIQISLNNFNKDSVFKTFNINRIPYGTANYPLPIYILLNALIQESGGNDTPTEEIRIKWIDYVNNLSNGSYNRPENMIKIVANTIDTLQMK
ncbi:NTPase [Serratia marcescens]|uniref:KAP family P-loop NTPase fold protein n=1 Tax=unclassified Serratia (in: enterobacteria) TaxID=2647522 RepID=UPI0030A1F6CB